MKLTTSATRDIATPVTPATEELIKRLPKDYMLFQKDIVRANYVHLIVMGIIENDGHSYQFYVQTAILILVEDLKIKHTDPYELRIDAGYFDSDLNELTPKSL